MSRCQKIRKKNRKVCVGDMQDLITLKVREIQPPLFNTVDFDENFEDIDTNPEVYSLIETVTGLTYFDGVSTDIPVTHIIYIFYNEEVTAETWIEYDSRRIDILKVEDLDERKDFMKLTCTDKGLISKEASKI